MAHGLPYASTTVSVSRTQAQIFELVRAFGATDFAFTNINDPGESAVVFSVRFPSPNGQSEPGPKVMVKLEARTKGILLEMARRAGYRSRPERWKPTERQVEQASMMAWRVLHDEMKSRLVAVQYGVIEFVRAFMADMVSQIDGLTLGDVVQKRIESGVDPSRLLTGKP